MKRLVFLFVLSASLTISFAQDTVSVFQYNILRYGEQGCGAVADKNSYLKTIIDYYEPDIIGVNELYGYDNYAFNILINVLNQNGRSFYKKADFTSHPSSELYNMLYYNSEKFELIGQDVSNTEVRNIDHYHLYFKNSGEDSIIISPIVAHLKAGSSSSDRDRREEMAENVMSYLANVGEVGNWLMMGDFNIQSSNEASFQEFVNPANDKFKFYDPTEIAGSFTRNQTFSAYHTQSTRSSNIGDCGVAGGMDDRFDYILISDAIQHNEKSVSYAADSYETPGQDGKHFDNSILSGNTSLPSNVITALYNMSDHLPVMLKLVVNSEQGLGTTDFADNNLNVYSDSQLLTIEGNQMKSISLLDITGKVLIQNEISGEYAQLNVAGLKLGLYLLKIDLKNGGYAIGKLTLGSD